MYALHRFIERPDLIDLMGQQFVVLGAAAEMGPLRSLLRWGATVYAVDLPRPEAWRQLIAHARASPGRLRVPVPIGTLAYADGASRGRC